MQPTSVPLAVRRCIATVAGAAAFSLLGTGISEAAPTPPKQGGSQTGKPWRASFDQKTTGDIEEQTINRSGKRVKYDGRDVAHRMRTVDAALDRTEQPPGHYNGHPYEKRSGDLLPAVTPKGAKEWKYTIYDAFPKPDGGTRGTHRLIRGSAVDTQGTEVAHEWFYSPDHYKDFAILDYETPQVCGLKKPRTKRSATEGGAGCGVLNSVDWNKVRDEAKQKVRAVLGDKDHVKSLPNRSEKAMTGAEVKRVTEAHSAKLTEIGGLNESHLATKANIALWATSVAQTFEDENATSLDKAAALTAVVPGLGQAVGIADGIEHKDAETIAINTLALAGLVAAQAVPVVGELVDAVLLADQVVEGIITVYKWWTAPPPPAPTDPGAVKTLPVTKPSLECSVWWTYMDLKWDTSVNVPPNTKVIVKERGGKEYEYPASAGNSPGWAIAHGIGGSRTFDVFYRQTTANGKTLESQKRTVAKQQMEQSGFYCNTYVWEEAW